MMAQLRGAVAVKEPENSSLFSKMRVYDGENLKDTDPSRPRATRNTATTPASTKA